MPIAAVKCWGDNELGQLRLGDTNGEPMTQKLALPIALIATLAACPAHLPEVTTAPPVPPITVDVLATAKMDVTRLAAEADKQPLLARWSGPYDGVPPWDQVSVPAFPAAFTTGLALLAAEVTVVAESPEPATFANTLAALEDAGRYQNRAETLFAVMTSNLNKPDVQALDREWSPKFAAAYDAITFNSKLFARIAAVHAARASLTAEERRLVEVTHDRFVQGGAKLAREQKDALGKINQELAVLFTDFKNKVLADENTWILLENDAALEGLPQSLRASFKAAAEERKLAGKWIVVNSRSSVDAFLTASTRRDLREQVWRAFKNRGDNGGDSDTNAVIARIVTLRRERATLLGYASHAHWRMADTMAVEPAKAEALMLRVWPAALARVREEVADMQKIADRGAKQGAAKAAIEPWDYLHYAERVRKAKYDFDQTSLKPYFALDNMISASFFMAGELYGLAFAEITGKVSVFHPDVRVWEVKDKATGTFVGLFYGDYFTRTDKRSGAWAMGYQGRETFTGKVVTPIASNNNNFVKSAP
ncbi:MAG: M3 family peptidase, partial [Myxococcales bacterium]|nr:M3 family peptidase [Myxococcales bacterium]